MSVQDPAVLNVTLQLKLDHADHGFQTVLDFSHTDRSGCVLQYQSDGQLCWYCAGASLTARVPEDAWLRLRFGCDSAVQLAWLFVDDASPILSRLPRHPFVGQDVDVALGHWLGGSGRELWGEVKGVDVSGESREAPAVLAFHSAGREPSVSIPESFDARAKHCLTEAASFIQREDVIGAAHYLNELRALGYQTRIGAIDRVDLALLVTAEPPNADRYARDLLDIDIRNFGGLAHSFMTANLVSCAQSLYGGGEQQSGAFLADYQRRYGQHHVLTDVDLAQRRYGEGREPASVVVKNLAIGGLDYLDYFKGRTCGRPFKAFEIRSDGEVFSCCPSLLPNSIGNALSAKSIDELKNSPMQRKIEDSIVSQDFRYCRWIHCELIRDNLLPKAVPQAQQTYQPANFRLSYDSSCNLWCPSCRVEKIMAKGTQRQEMIRFTEEFILPALRSGKTCMMNGYGDIFASRACRKILEAANPADYPELKFIFITNGVLFTRSEWDKLPGIHNMVRSIRVSIDAARKETYDQVRLGGNWDALMENLEFMGELRRENVIRFFAISFVIQDSNFEEMADFAELGRRLGCDYVIYEPLMDWNVFSLETFKQKAVHYPSHPRHSEFKAELARISEVLLLTPSAPNAEDEDARPDSETTAWINF